ncbi:uncharacterized protein LOC124182411 isoform X1 [Neodiprion fabricii]|uniref:uncharacterized protein LOC124182411 isoform X1 n=2 Tax=Neodiprion fabricii TaxID=2872261 RepID=UPI001ED97ABE|nr:uncharacterized protein LOC124182411 isoform X1 [Neodiprion fabricii]
MDTGDGNPDPTCFGSGSIAGAVIGTFLTTILLLAVAALFYRQWRRHKGKHLVLVTDPEIVEDAYAFDNPCFKDAATPAAITRTIERPMSAASAVSVETPVKDATRWSTSWSSLGLGSAVRNDKRRTLDDSCLGPKAMRVSLVSLRSRDFTGLGFNVCGNMREGIFVKDLLNRGPASESGRIHPGDRIASVKISFRNMVYEDALTILSYASPYDVELEVENGGPGSKPTTLLKKSVSQSPMRICHPLYRSQSIPELTPSNKSTAKRLFTADLSDTLGSSYSTMNSTMKSSKSATGNQSLERRSVPAEDGKSNHHKFGIKVLPALDGMVHRIENQNEHNTNLERRNSKKMDAEEILSNSRNVVIAGEVTPEVKKTVENLQQRENNFDVNSRMKTAVATSLGPELNGIDVPDKGEDQGRIPSEIPEEVHNAAVAARRNRRNSAELLSQSKTLNESFDADDTADSKSSLQKNKRKAPAPPKEKTLAPEPAQSVSRKETVQSSPLNHNSDGSGDKFDSITDYTESLNDYVTKVRETMDGAEARRERLANQTCRRNSESDTDSELQNSFTTIELNPADITIHHTPVPEVDDDIYRKAASLGDLSKYESKATSTLERAQSLDMTDTGSKKRKAPLPPEDINESTEDLTKLDDMDTFQRRKLKKSNEWGTLEDAIWGKVESEVLDEEAPRTRKKSKGTLERSKSAVEMKPKQDSSSTGLKHFDVSNVTGETSIELYNLPLSKKLTYDFIHGERMFNPDQDNSLARIVNNGDVVKSPTFEEVELDFRQAKPLIDDEKEARLDLDEALEYFDLKRSAGEAKIPVENIVEKREAVKSSEAKPIYYYNNVEVVEEPMTKTIVDTSCPGCRRALNGHQNESCNKHSDRPDSKIPDIIQTTNDRDKTNSSFANEQQNYRTESNDVSENRRADITSPVFQINRQKFDPFDVAKPAAPASSFHIQSTKVEPLNTEEKRESVSTFQTNRTKFEQAQDSLAKKTKSAVDAGFETHFAKRVMNLANDKDASDALSFEPGSNVTVNSKSVPLTSEDRHNISNVSVSSGDIRESSPINPRELNRQESDTTPPLPSTPMPLPIPHKLTYITEIKVSTSQENLNDIDGNHDEIVGMMEGGTDSISKQPPQLGVTVTSNGKPVAGKKPPIPPRRSDVAKLAKEELEKQVVYVSEYKSSPSKDPAIQVAEGAGSEMSRTSGGIGKKFEQWVFLGENKDNVWENSGGQPQPVTNIVLTSNEDKMIHQ